MELRQLRTFQTVAKLLNFNRSAEILNYSQSTVSTQIRLLEEELGVPLFDRLGKNVGLTEAGNMLVKYSQKILDIEKETFTKVSGCEESCGSISIRIPQSIGTYILPSVLSEFRIKFPKVGFDISSCTYSTLRQELKTGITDVAFLLADSIPLAELKTEMLGIESLVLVSNPDHNLAKKPTLHIGDLAGESILLPKHDCTYKMLFEQALTEEKIDSAIFMELNSIEAIKQCVIKGVGVTMIPMMSVVREIEQKKLVVLPWAVERFETAILMIWHRDKWLSPTLQAFMDTVRKVIKDKDHAETS